jgi:hypothetical protein
MIPEEQEKATAMHAHPHRVNSDGVRWLVNLAEREAKRADAAISAERAAWKTEKARLLKALGMCGCDWCAAHPDPTENDELMDKFFAAHPETPEGKALVEKMMQRMHERFTRLGDAAKAREEEREKCAKTVEPYLKWLAAKIREGA